MIRNISLTPGGRSALMFTAYEMTREGRKKKKVRDEMIEGTVTTDGSRANSGGFRGTIFNATVASELGEGNVRFVVRDQFLAMDPNDFYAFDGVWERAS